MSLKFPFQRAPQTNHFCIQEVLLDGHFIDNLVFGVFSYISTVFLTPKWPDFSDCIKELEARSRLTNYTEQSARHTWPHTGFLQAHPFITGVVQ